MRIAIIVFTCSCEGVHRQGVSSEQLARPELGEGGVGRATDETGAFLLEPRNKDGVTKRHTYSTRKAYLTCFTGDTYVDAFPRRQAPQYHVSCVHSRHFNVPSFDATELSQGVHAAL